MSQYGRGYERSKMRISAVTTMQVVRKRHTGPHPALAYITTPELGKRLFQLGYVSRDDWRDAVTGELIKIGSWVWKLNDPRTVDEGQLKIAYSVLPYAEIDPRLGDAEGRNGITRTVGDMWSTKGDKQEP